MSAIVQIYYANERTKRSASLGAEGPSGVGAVAVLFGALSALIATWVTVGFGRRVWRLRHALRARHVGGGTVVFGDHIAYADGLTSIRDVAVVLREVNRAPYRGATRVAVVALEAPERIRQRLRAALAWDLDACALVWLVAAAPAAVSAAFGFALLARHGARGAPRAASAEAPGGGHHRARVASRAEC